MDNFQLRDSANRGDMVLGDQARGIPYRTGGVRGCYVFSNDAHYKLITMQVEKSFARKFRPSAANYSKYEVDFHVLFTGAS